MEEKPYFTRGEIFTIKNMSRSEEQLNINAAKNRLCSFFVLPAVEFPIIDINAEPLPRMAYPYK